MMVVKLSDKIREIMVERGISTNAELLNRMKAFGIDRTATLADILRDKVKKPHIGTLSAIASALEVPVSTLTEAHETVPDLPTGNTDTPKWAGALIVQVANLQAALQAMQQEHSRVVSLLLSELAALREPRQPQEGRVDRDLASLPDDPRRTPAPSHQ